MPSSKTALTAKLAARDLLLAEKDAELVAQAAEILTLRERVTQLEAENRTLNMECGALENILAYNNGSFGEMKALIEKMPGGLVAAIGMILGRHGYLPVRPESSPWQ